MPRFPAIEEDDAPPEVAELFADFRQEMGFPKAPNFIRTQGGAALNVGRGTWELVRNVLVEGSVPRSVKEMMFVAISTDRHCGYCEAAHVACCKMLGVDSATIEALINDIDSVHPDRINEIVKFALQCSRDPQGLTDADFESLRKHGLGDAEIMEIIAMSALAVYANTIADATQIDNDDMFTSFD